MAPGDIPIINRRNHRKRQMHRASIRANLNLQRFRRGVPAVRQRIAAASSAAPAASYNPKIDVRARL